MKLAQFLSPGAVVVGVKANGKKQALQELAAAAARLSRLSERAIFETLLQRERLGSTGIGHGIAIPHGRIAGLKQLTGVFVRLARPVDFEAMDGEPVDLAFVLLAPEDAGADHLQALARIARVLRSPIIARKLRQIDDPDALYAILIGSESSAAA